MPNTKLWFSEHARELTTKVGEPILFCFKRGGHGVERLGLRVSQVAIQKSDYTILSKVTDSQNLCVNGFQRPPKVGWGLWDLVKILWMCSAPKKSRLRGPGLILASCWDPSKVKNPWIPKVSAGKSHLQKKQQAMLLFFFASKKRHPFNHIGCVQLPKAFALWQACGQLNWESKVIHHFFLPQPPRKKKQGGGTETKECQREKMGLFVISTLISKSTQNLLQLSHFLISFPT
jgi:hypothetical protein